MLGQLSVHLDIGGKVAELVVVQQPLQVQIAGGDVARKAALSVECEANGSVAGCRTQLVARTDFL